MLIVVEDQIQGEGVTVFASSATAAMGPERLRTPQVSVRWRATSIGDTPYIDGQLQIFSFGTLIGVESVGYDFIALVGYDGAPTRNMTLGNLLLAESAPEWARTNHSTLPVLGAEPPAGLRFVVYKQIVTGAGAAYIEQEIQTPGKGSEDIGSAELSLSSAFIVKQVSGHDVDFRIRAFSGGGTDFAHADFDLSTGTAGATSDGGGYTADGSEIVDLGDGYFRCRLIYTTDGADDIKIRGQFLTAAGSTTMAGAEELHILAPATMLQSADWSVAEYPLVNTVGPMFQVRLANDNLFDEENEAQRSGWKHAASRNVMRQFPRFSFFHRYSTIRPEPRVRVELWDVSNPNGYIEAGRLIVGRSVALKGVATSHGLSETSGELRMDGGQVYRAQGVVTRRLEMVLRYRTRELAFDELHFLRRTAGRSRPVFVVAEETDPLYMQEGMVHGYIDELPPMPVSGRDGRFEVPLVIAEAL